MKIFKCFIFISFFLFCFSCVTDNSIYTANVSNNTQLYFLRPVQINVKNESLKTVDFDITLYVKDNELVGTPILNCTYYIPLKNSKNADKFTLEITNDEITLSAKNKRQLLKNIVKDKYLEIRYSYQLDNEEIYALLQNDLSVKIKITYPDTNVNFFESDDFNVKIDNLRILFL